MRAAVLVLLFACGGKGAVDPAYAPAGSKPCESMAAHVVGVMGGEASGSAAEQLRGVLVAQCRDGKWTIDAQRCFEQLRTFDESDRCVPLLTVDQREAFASAIDAVFPSESQ